MTQNRRAKRAIRARMEETGEKYTEARRSLLGSQAGRGGPADERDVTFVWPQDSLGWFTDQAYNAILLAEDEARMLSHASVEPEHLLLAASRRGNGESLLPGLAPAIHDAIVRITGFGAKLEPRPRRSMASDEVLRDAVETAAARGILGPSTEHLLLALEKTELPRRMLREVGIANLRALVDARYPARRPPLGDVLVRRRAAQLAAHGRTPPSPGPIPPIFERFTSQARAAIDTGIEEASRLNDPCVEPVHLLLGVLRSEAGVAANICSRGGWEIQPGELIQPRRPTRPANSSTYLRRPPRIEHEAWIFNSEARRIVAEDVLVIAERLGYRALTTGHLLIALAQNPDERASGITRLLPGRREITIAVTGALAHEEER